MISLTFYVVFGVASNILFGMGWGINDFSMYNKIIFLTMAIAFCWNKKCQVLRRRRWEPGRRGAIPPAVGRRGY